MAWWSRNKPPQQQTPRERKEQIQETLDIDEAMREADRAIIKVQEQKREQRSIAQALRDVRARNHLAEIFGHDGIGA